MPVAAAAAAAPALLAGAQLFWSALGGLVTLGIGLAITRLIEDLYARAAWLGYARRWRLPALAALALARRRAAGRSSALLRLASIEKLRARAEAALASDDRDEARAIVRALTARCRAAPALARGRAELDSASRRKSSTARDLRAASPSAR